ncbi:MAG: peptidoglycan bridge formation glycyltransferase FemA/FemB family protein [Anaerolineae bacterium]|nr:peptidoglycan bridge formation glycyltransferase FemA/FemB family protein [Anaerolineae bacterium]
MAEGAYLEPVLSAEEWEKEVSRLPQPHFLQSAPWARFKEAYGWKPERYRLHSGGRVLAYASVLARRLVGPLTVAYVPRGPLLVQPDAISLDLALASLEELARGRHWLMLKVDPEIWDEDARAWARPVLEERSWRPGQQVQFRNTVQMDITDDEEKLLSRMKPKTRYNVRLASRRGVQVHPLAEDEFGLAYDLYRRTGLRDGFIVRPRSYYEHLWSTLLEAGMGTVLAAEYEGTALAALVAVAHGNTCWYFHGASGDEHRNLMPTYLLQWEAIRWARARGCAIYDLWGAPESESQEDGMSGVLRFKLGFGGRFREGLGAWDYTPVPALYRLYTAVAPRLLGLGRHLRRRTQRHD